MSPYVQWPYEGLRAIAKVKMFLPQEPTFPHLETILAFLRITPYSHFQLLWFIILGMGSKTMHFKETLQEILVQMPTENILRKTVKI